MSNKNSFLDMDVLAKGCKIEEDTTSYPMEVSYIPPAQQPIYPPQNMMPFAQPQPILQSIPQAEVKIQDTYETPEEYLFWEEDNSYEIHVTVISNLKKEMTGSNCSIYDARAKRKDICITKFLIDSIKKIIVEELNQDTVQFVIQCRYYDKSKRKEQIIKIIVDEETLNSDSLVPFIRKKFGSQHTPFPPKKDSDFNYFLSKYIMDRFHSSPSEEYISPSPILNDIRTLSDPERKSVVKLFYKIYHNASNEMKLLLSAGFWAVCCDKLGMLESEAVTSGIPKTIIIYGCKNNEHQKYIAALSCTSTDRIVIRKLSGIKVTAQQDELKQIFFKNQYQPLFFTDDEISSYSKNQNIAKIHRITEYVSNGIQRTVRADIPSTAVVFTSRKLSEFETFSDNCIFINAADVSPQDYSSEDAQCIVTNFLSLLYENTDYYFKNKAERIHYILNTVFGADMLMKMTISLCEIYHFIVKSLFDNYGIGSNEEDMILKRCLKKRTKSISMFLNENRSILSHERISVVFADKINSLIQTEKLQVKLYDKSISAVNQALLYEHIGTPVLLFSNKYFEELFASPVVDEKTLREILNEYGYVVANYSEKCNFRMPIDDRKLYVAVKVSVLDEQSCKLLPDLHPAFIPDPDDGIDRIFLADDEHGNPIYWPVGKIENRSVLVQGNTRMGKTFFTTTKLIMGLHELGYRIVIFDSAASSYNNYELGKCGYDEAFIAEHFCHGKAETANEIMSEFENAVNKVYIVSSDADDTEKQKLCDLLFKYQKTTFNANPENTPPLFIVFEEAGDSTLYDTPELKRIYNQGSKLRLSVITILQMFSGKGSQRFRKMVGQASLKVSFKCSTDHIRYFTEVIPPEIRAKAKERLPMLGIGEAIICGDFENPDGSLYTGGFMTSKN